MEIEEKEYQKAEIAVLHKQACIALHACGSQNRHIFRHQWKLFLLLL
jgi:hypothetical protein